MTLERHNISSGSPREPKLGYSRAVKIGNQIFVSGTTSGGVGNTAEAQTREIFSRIEMALSNRCHFHRRGSNHHLPHRYRP
jgi:enamine deaminase RidA (YjgF/YER057c/UK114 family)